MKANYKSFIERLALSYLRASAVKEFPFPLKTATVANMEFENEADRTISPASSTLNQLAFVVGYTK